MTFSTVVGDVRELHNRRLEYQGAVFQVASQFNCLEMVNPGVTPENGITMYEADRTQGPACAIACAPATAFRNYLTVHPNDIGRLVYEERRLPAGEGDRIEAPPPRFAFNYGLLGQTAGRQIDAMRGAERVVAKWCYRHNMHLFQSAPPPEDSTVRSFNGGARSSVPTESPALPLAYWIVKNGYLDTTPELLQRINAALEWSDDLDRRRGGWRGDLTMLPAGGAVADRGGGGGGGGESFRRELRDAIRIGVQYGTQVSNSEVRPPLIRDPASPRDVVDDASGVRPSTSSSEPPPMLVTQTFNSALGLTYSRNVPAAHRALWEPLARIVLESTYEATFLVAVERANSWWIAERQRIEWANMREAATTERRPRKISLGLPDDEDDKEPSSRTRRDTERLVLDDHSDAKTPPVASLDASAAAAKATMPPPLLLTKVGGGVFGNERDWIIAAMERAARVTSAYLHPAVGPLRVCLVHFGSVERGYEDWETQMARADAHL